MIIIKIAKPKPLSPDSPGTGGAEGLGVTLVGLVAAMLNDLTTSPFLTNDSL